MDQTAQDSPILVGIDGTEQATRAAEFGWQEARLHGRGLLLVTAYPPYIPMSPMLPYVGFENLRTVSSRLLRQAVVELRERCGTEIPISAKAVEGRTKRVLIHTAETASLVVLGRKYLQGLSRALLGATSLAVAARSVCPVVIVPSSWTPRQTSRIVVGVDGSTDSLEAMRFAFQQASMSGGRIVALHAWPAVEYDVYVSRLGDAIEDWEEKAELSLAEALAGWAEEFPEVPVSRVIDRRNPVESLVELSREADLVVVGTHGHGRPARMAVGSVTRHVMTDAACPVVVVQHDRSHKVHAVDLASTKRAITGELALTTF
jgi:nucleotide-binding universal stress UspA family protein